MLLLSALVVGLGNVWADEETYTFTSKSWAATDSNGESADWTSGKDGNALTGGQGIQVTTGATGANGTSPDSFANISEIVVTYCTNNKNGVGEIVVQVGDGAEQTFTVTPPSSGGTTLKEATFTYSPEETGNVKVTVNCSTNSIYIYSVKITYTPSGGDDPTISADPTSLSPFTYVVGSGPSAAQTISVSGSNLTDDIYLMVSDGDEYYEISTPQNSGYSDEVTLDKGEGTVSATNIYVRLKSGLAKGTYDGTLTILTDDGASGYIEKEVSLSGSVTGQLYAVTVATGLTGGEIAADPTSAAEGTEVTLSATPSSGYRLSAWDVYKTGETSTKVTVINNKFTMPDYAVTVSATFEVIPSVTYTLATSVVPGRHYIIVGKKDDVYKAMGSTRGNNRNAVDITVSNGSTSIRSDAGVYEFLIEVDEDGYFTIFDEDNDNGGYLYAGGSGNNNYLNTGDYTEEKGQWKITFDGNVATIKAISTNRNWMRYNNGNNPPIFACYGSGQQDIYLFERDGDTGTQDFTASINAACTDGTKCYGTFSAPFAFTVPADVTVSEIGIDNENKLDIDEYEAGAIIPANTGVMISSTTAGNKTFTSAKGGTSVKGANNKLRPTYWGLTAEEMDDADASCLFYRLTMHGGTTLGFFWGAASGAAFDLAANKAYLAVPTGAGGVKEFFTFDFDGDADGINSLTPALSEGEGAIYNVAGQRVEKPNKGLYIVNGKKVLF